ncbi:MAG TPA: hypothetical protein VNT79_18655 [Phycisphaerae bacterium]|nr:hypothetical protein [Phycisphaerae bacterium]
MTPLLARSLCAVAALCSLAHPVLAEPGVDVAKALDQPLARISIAEQELPAALAEMGRQAGVEIVLDDASAALLPWGSQTKVKQVVVQNAALREILPQILGALGMRYEIREDKVVVLAGDPLKRINRRATWDDLKLLRELNETSYTPANFENVRLQYRLTSKIDAPGLLHAQLAKSGQGTVAQILEVATGSLGWVWFPNGDHVAIRTMEAQIANRMARRVTIKYANEPLSKILIDLADRAETAIDFEPGMMLKLPPNIADGTSVILNQSSIRQAFELLQAETGIRYEIRRTGIWVGLSDEMREAVATADGSAPRRAGGYVAKITIPGGDGSYSFDMLLRAEELPDDVLEYRRQIIEEYIEKVRAEMGPDNAKHSPGGAGQ